MTRMTDNTRAVIAGVDTHANTHQGAALDEHGRLLGVHTFPATEAGYGQLLGWLCGFGQVRQVGVEGSGSYGAGLTRHLQAAGVSVIEINRPHAHTRARRGKNDAIDAEAAARKVLAGECAAVPKDTTGVVEAIRQLHLARASAVQARAAALHQLGQMALTAPTPVRTALTASTLLGKAHQAARWRPDPARLADPGQAARMALRSLARRIDALSTEIAALDAQLSMLVTGLAPHTLALVGVGVVNAARLLMAAGQNIDRLSSEAAFAHLCGVAPIPASSGKTQRHRLNPGGNREANCTLHMIAVVRLRYDQRTRAYTTRRTTEGKSKKEIIRCLKRYIAREIYHTLRADLKNLAPAP
jgi:transposase